MARCEECGFDWDRPPDELAGALRTLPRRCTAPLTRFLPADADGEHLIRTRPEPGVWSAIEYVAHTADAIAFYEERIRLVLDEDGPALPGFEPDRVAEAARYADRDTRAVLDHLAGRAESLASLLEGLAPGQWVRSGTGLDGGPRDVAALARRAVHEGEHHLLDVGRVLRRVREARRPEQT